MGVKYVEDHPNHARCNLVILRRRYMDYGDVDIPTSWETEYRTVPCPTMPMLAPMEAQEWTRGGTQGSNMYTYMDVEGRRIWTVPSSWSLFSSLTSKQWCMVRNVQYTWCTDLEGGFHPTHDFRDWVYWGYWGYYEWEHWEWECGMGPVRPGVIN